MPFTKNRRDDRASQSARQSVASGATGAMLANWLFPLYVLMIVAGYFVLRLPAANVAGSEMTADRAFFSAVNAATLTGFQSVVPLDHLRPLAVATMLALMFGGILFTLIVGSLAVLRIADLPYDCWQVVRGSIFWTFGASVVGTIGLLPGHSVAVAIFLAVSSFGNCGLFTGALPGALQWQSQLIILPLAVLGGVGLPVLMEVWRGWGNLSRHSRTTLSWYASIYLLTLIALFVAKAASMNTGDANLATVLGNSSTFSANARTLGLPLVSMAWLTRPMQWILMAAMFIGAAPASTGGGIKVTCVAEIFRSIRRAWRGENPGRVFAIAAVWVGLFVAMLAIALLLILGTNPEIPADKALFEVISAAGNVGFSFDPISMVGAGLYVLTATMFLGRVGALLVVWWQADSAPGSGVAVA